MVTIVFRSKLREPDDPAFQSLAERMLELAQAMPGFVSYKVFVAEDGERCSLIEFESEDHLRAWREHSEHRAAQQRGRDELYAHYSLYVSGSGRVSEFRRA